VTKTQLLTQTEKQLSKITYASKPPKKVKGWELEVDPSLSYAYDKGLRFGLVHTQNGKDWIPQTPLTDEQQTRFNNILNDLTKVDPLKQSILRDTYPILVQPIPNINPQTVGELEGRWSSEEYYKAITLSRLANLPLSRTYQSHQVSDWIRSMIDSYYRAHNILIPTTTELRLGSDKKYVTGALTITPESGTYFDMAVLDFESLYPGVVDVYNLSYETIQCGHAECQSNKVPGQDINVCIHRRGIFSAMIGALRDLRIHYYKPLLKTLNSETEEYRMTKAANAILKLVLVASYGVTVRIHGLASPLLGEAITAYGRDVLQTTFDLAKKEGLQPKYGDTDSVFLDNPSEQQIEKFIQQVRDKYKLELAYERRYSVCVLSSAKKAYFGILANGETEIKGLTVAKSNSPRFFLKTFRECLSLLAKGRTSPQEFEAAKQGTRAIVSNAMSTLRQSGIPLSDLEYRVELREDPKTMINARTLPQPYQAAVLALEVGQNVSRGQEVGFVKVHPFKHGGRTFTVKPTDQAKIAEVNIDDYVRNLLSSLDQTFEPMGIKLGASSVPSLSEF
jgi:DNA polymerase I